MIAIQFPEMLAALREYGVSSHLIDYIWLIPGVSFSYILYFPVGNYLSAFWIKHLREKKSRDDETAADRVKRCKSYLMGSIYYMSSFLLTLLVAVHCDYLPIVYGGSLNLTQRHAMWPVRSEMSVRVVYMFSFGHHLERLVVHVLANYKTSTFYTMLLHHIIAVGLIAISFQSEYLDFGIAVLLMLDLSDSLLQLARFFRETVFWKVSKALFLLMSVSWLHGRIFGMFWEVLPTVYTLISNANEFTRKFFGVHLFYFSSLFILACLNGFWLFQILKVFVVIFVHGKEKLEYEDNHLNKKKVA
jgi:hypothetical protein